jgi:nitroreductase
MTPDSPLLQLVDLATRAPSGHNAQPWTIVRTEGQGLVLRSEPRRWLRMIDPTNRELLLSFGALIETIRQAAPAVGYRVGLQVLADRADATDIALVDLATAPAVSSNAPALIGSRATTRTPFLPIEVDVHDLEQLMAGDENALSFVPRESTGSLARRRYSRGLRPADLGRSEAGGTGRMASLLSGGDPEAG